MTASWPVRGCLVPHAFGHVRTPTGCFFLRARTTQSQSPTPAGDVQAFEDAERGDDRLTEEAGEKWQRHHSIWLQDLGDWGSGTLCSLRVSYPGDHEGLT